MSGAAAAQQAISNAVMASGAIIKIDNNSFINLLSKMDSAVVIEAKGGVFGTRWNYLTNYKNFYFFTKSKEKIGIPSRHELIKSSRIWVPGV